MNGSSYMGGWKYKSGEPFICQIVKSISVISKEDSTVYKTSYSEL